VARLARDKLRLTAFSLLLVLLVRLAVSVWALCSGFRALSDDDFSRVVIAQGFAFHPSWDPSGTSWLPFPFWLYGTCLSLFGTALANARTIAFTLGLLSALGTWLAGRWLGLSRNASLLGVTIACSIPYAAWLGVATTPDYLNAVLLLLACSSLARGKLTLRILGVAALCAATLSRYEAWAVAITWVLLLSTESHRRNNWRLFLLAAVALAAPLAWVLHGAWHHHDAFFFIKRVVGYRRALGIAEGGSASRLLSTPSHLLLDAPEIWLLAAVCAIGSRLLLTRPLRRRWFKPFLAMASVVAFLMIGDWRDGSATHHLGRTLLPFWMFMCLIVAKSLLDGTRVLARHLKWCAIAAIVAVYALAWGALRPALTKVDSLSPRIEETEIGILASTKLRPGQRLAVLTNDYGYFAVQAAFARPWDTDILDSHDPRHPAATSVVASRSSLCEAMNARQAQWLVVPNDQEPLLSNPAHVRFRGATLLLAEWQREPNGKPPIP
jgi:hypothetical protein